MTGARIKHYGWGREGEGMSAEERKFVLGRYRAKFATDEFDTIAVPGLEDLSLREPRVVPPASLAPFCTTERYDRAAHIYGKSYPDYVVAMLGAAPEAMHRRVPVFLLTQASRSSSSRDRACRPLSRRAPPWPTARLPWRNEDPAASRRSAAASLPS
jgi:hypothetical protein